MKTVFIDVETTGLDPKLHGIWSIAGLICEGGKTLDSFDFKVDPYDNDQIDSEALEVGGISELDFAGFADPAETKDALCAKLGGFCDQYDKKDKMFFAAYNASFDNQFMREWFLKGGDDYFGSWFWTPAIDIMTLAGVYLRGERPGMKNFKLKTVAEAMGLHIDEARLHEAIYDVELAMQIYYRVCHNWR